MAAAEEMRAVRLKAFGNASQLFLGTAKKPQINHSNAANPSVVVKVKAIGVNRADIVQREGRYPAPPGESDILGLEVAGEIAETVAGSKWKTGDRVMALISGGGYSEYCLVPESLLMPIPSRISFTEAACIPEVFSTAYQALFWLGDLRDKQSLLIHGGASGVGTAAIQLARKLRREVSVVVTASSQDKLDACRALGATETINYKTTPDFDAVLKEKVAGGGVDLLIDYIGGAYFDKNLRSLKLDGKLVLLGLLSGPNTPSPVSLGPILMKRLSILGSTLRSRTLEYRSRLTSDVSRNVLPLIESQAVKPVLDQVFSWNDVQKAHEHIEQNRNIGKVILAVD